MNLIFFLYIHVQGQANMFINIYNTDNYSRIVNHSKFVIDPVRLECAAKEVSDEVVKAAMALAHEAIQPIIAAQESALSPRSPTAPSDDPVSSSDQPTVATSTEYNFFHVSQQLSDIIHELGWQKALELYGNSSASKSERGRSEGVLRHQLLSELEAHPIATLEASVCRSMAVDKLMNSAFRAVTIGMHRQQESEGKTKAVRVDGRTATELRPISCAPAVLPSVHGSAYFARGDTHVLCTTTLGSREDALVRLLYFTSLMKELPVYLNFAFIIFIVVVFFSSFLS